LSNMKVTVSLLSSSFTVMISSFPANHSILAMLLRFIPIEMLQSHQLWTAIGAPQEQRRLSPWPGVRTQLRSNRSLPLIASKTFFSRESCTKWSSSILKMEVLVKKEEGGKEKKEEEKNRKRVFSPATIDTVT
ncbi:hypothetical protein S83_012535, partial [Arachis hypogaea]